MNVSIIKNMKQTDSVAIFFGLLTGNARFVNPSRFGRFGALARDENDEVIAGVVAQQKGQWMEIEGVWVEESQRRKGLASDLVKLVEGEAILRGCTTSMLDTYSFQTRPFFESVGYELAFSLSDFPEKGICSYKMLKTLGDS